MPKKASTIILLRGQPGVGKSYFGMSLAQRLSAVYLDKDDVKDVLTENIEDSKANLNVLSYDVLFNFLET